MQLTGMDIMEAINMSEKCATLMENSPFFKKILPAMMNYFETDKYIFDHGWIPCEALGYSGNATTFLYQKTGEKLVRLIGITLVVIMEWKRQDKG